MALTINEIVASTLFRQRKETADNIMSSIAAFNALAAKGKVELVSGGYELREPAVYQHPTVQWFTGYEQLGSTPTENLTCFQYDWKQAQAPVIIDGMTVRKNKGSEQQLINLLTSKMDCAKNALKAALQTSIRSDGTGSGSKELGGLRYLIKDTPTSGTIGGIDISTYTWAANQYTDFSADIAKAASAATIQEGMVTLYLKCVRGNEVPDLVLSGQTYWAYYHNSLQAIARITNPNDTLAKAGFRTLEFMSASVVLDNYTTDTTPRMYFINTDTLKFVAHEDLYFAPLGGKREPVDQDAVLQYIGVMGNLVCNNPHLNGVLHD